MRLLIRRSFFTHHSKSCTHARNVVLMRLHPRCLAFFTMLSLVSQHKLPIFTILRLLNPTFQGKNLSTLAPGSPQVEVHISDFHGSGSVLGS
jgi:hypothetical protein